MLPVNLGLANYLMNQWHRSFNCLFLKNIYLFILFFLAASGLGCSVRASLQLRYAGFSLVVVCRLLSSCGTWALQLRHTGSVVVARGLSCPAACKFLVPLPGIEPASPALEDGFLTTGPPGKSPFNSFYHKRVLGE